MRLSLISLLLLTAATPALAQSEPEQATQEAETRETPRRAERSYDGEPRGIRAESAGRAERVERAERFRPRDPAPDSARAAAAAERWNSPPAAAPSEPVRDVARAAAAEQWQRRGRDGERTRSSTDSSWSNNRGWRGESGERRGRNRNVPPTEASPVFGSAIPTPGTITRPRREVSTESATGRDLRDRIAAEGLRRDRVEREGWRREWRQDRRYDWRSHRNRDRSRFHLGIYIDPFGWGYRDYDIGWQLPSRLYRSSYWIADPWYYRLPPVSGPYRWVRYYDDVLLIDLRTGRVLDRIRGFFW